MQSSINKRRDMARSILPSTYRAPQRLIKKAKRANRRAIRQELQSLTTDVDRGRDAWDERTDLRAYPDIEIAWLVRWRRGGDKLNHFERWAIEITKDVRHEDRLSFMRSILPDGLIGDHAMSHLQHLRELNPRPMRYYNYTPEERQARTAHFEEVIDRRRGRLISAIELLIDDGRHREINTALKRVEPEDAPPLLITDPNRIGDFVDELLTRKRHGAIIRLDELNRLLAFLEREHYLRPGDVDFTLRYANGRYY